MSVLMSMTRSDLDTGWNGRRNDEPQLTKEHLQSAQPRSLSGSMKSLLLYIIPVVVSMLLLLAGDIEENPGPETQYTQLGKYYIQIYFYK